MPLKSHKPSIYLYIYVDLFTYDMCVYMENDLP